MRKILIVGFLGVLAGLYWLSPYLAVLKLEQAVVDRDRAVLETLIDWPRVREGLKADLNAKLGVAALDRMKDSASGLESAGAMIGMALGSRLTDAALDNFFSAASAIQALEKTTYSNDELRRRLRSAVRQAGFLSATDFRLEVGLPEEPSNTATLLLHFEGMTWRVVRVILPRDL